MQQTSGQYGAALTDGEPISTLANWTVSATSDTKQFVASNTHGGTGRRKGNEDWTGSCKQYVGWPSFPQSMMPAGDQWNFLGYLAPRTGIPGAVGPSLGGIVLTESSVLTIDWAGSNIIDLTTNFVGNGELVWVTDNLAVDNTNPIAIPAKEATIYLGLFSLGTPVYEPLCTLKAVLTFKANMYPFSSSCTGGFVNRVSGTKDWSIVVTMDDPDMNNLVLDLDQNQYVGIKIVYSSGDEILLQWGLVKDITNINIDIETGAMISYDVLIEMSVDSGVDTGIANSTVSLPSTQAIGSAAAPYIWWPQY